jgi:hypothetical protein
MSDEQVNSLFQAVGRIEQKVDGLSGVFTTHTEHDAVVQKALFERLEGLQLSHAKQRGFFSALAAGGSVIGAGVGYAIEKWLGLGH